MLSLVAGLFGLIIGSFLNVFVMRHGARSLRGRSVCFSCSSQIRWYDNIPLVSWLVLRGRCRHCRSSISAQYPVVEALTGILFALIFPVLLYGVTAFSVQEVAVLIAHGLLVSLLIAIAVYDARHTIIPDAWVYSCAALALFIALLTHPVPLSIIVLSGPAAALPLFTLWLVSRGRWMGLGDAKLALGFGWFLGPYFGVIAIFLAFVIGAVVSVCILLPLPYLMKWLRTRGIARLSAGAAHFTMKSEVAFGPFLVAAFFITWISLLYQIPLPV